MKKKVSFSFSLFNFDFDSDWKDLTINVLAINDRSLFYVYSTMVGDEKVLYIDLFFFHIVRLP